MAAFKSHPTNCDFSNLLIFCKQFNTLLLSYFLKKTHLNLIKVSRRFKNIIHLLGYKELNDTATIHRDLYKYFVGI